MPKRILDDSLLSSPSLAKCSPRAQDAWHRFLLLMDDFGCSEATPRVLLGKGWPLRDDVSEADIRGWLEEYVGAGMAVLWTENERRYVHLTGWFGPHGQRHRDEYDSTTVKGRKGSKRKTPKPPDDLIAAVAAGLRRDADGKPPGTDREIPTEIPSDSVPARETQIPAANPVRTRGDAAPAVPDAVPDAQLRSLRGDPRSGVTAEEWPLTAAVLAACWDRGWEAEWPKGRAAAKQVEAAIGAVTIPVAVDRLMAHVEAERAQRLEPRPWLGWHLEVINPRPKQSKPSAQARPDPSQMDYSQIPEDMCRGTTR